MVKAACATIVFLLPGVLFTYQFTFQLIQILLSLGFFWEDWFGWSRNRFERRVWWAKIDRDWDWAWCRRTHGPWTRHGRISKVTLILVMKSWENIKICFVFHLSLLEKPTRCIWFFSKIKDREIRKRSFSWSCFFSSGKEAFHEAARQRNWK